MWQSKSHFWECMQKKQHIIYMIYISYVVWYATMPYCKKKRYVQWWHHQQYICILYQRKKTTLLNKPQCTAGYVGSKTCRSNNTHAPATLDERSTGPSTAPRSGTTHNSKCLRFATCTNCINYVSVQCRCNDALSLFASFAYHLWKMVVKLPYCAPSASCHHSVLYNYTHYTLNHWSSGRIRWITIPGSKQWKRCGGRPPFTFPSFSSKHPLDGQNLLTSQYTTGK